METGSKCRDRFPELMQNWRFGGRTGRGTGTSKIQYWKKVLESSDVNQSFLLLSGGPVQEMEAGGEAFGEFVQSGSPAGLFLA